MQSITHGQVNFEEMYSLIKEYISRDGEAKYRICVGTDSQNTDLTKVVVVVAVHRISKGGIFFYDIRHVRKIKSLQQKIFYETSLSLDLASKLSERLKKEDFIYQFEVHADIGEDGPTSKIIPEITGWIKACGFDCRIKPDSFAASTIADRISK